MRSLLSLDRCIHTFSIIEDPFAGARNNATLPGGKPHKRCICICYLTILNGALCSYTFDLKAIDMKGF